MNGRTEPGFEIRRILLLTRLREYSRGLTLPRIVSYCRQVSGWTVHGQNLSEVVRHVLQTLIDDKLVVAKARFVLTKQGLDYLEDPLRWNMQVETSEEAERNMFWRGIYDVFDRAYAMLRSRSQAKVR